MADRDKILRYFKASGDEELAARLVDLAEAARKIAKYKVSEFLDPHLAKLSRAKLLRNGTLSFAQIF